MNHDEIQQKLFALYDGPLTEKERALAEKHLAKCSECRRAIAEWKALSASLFAPPAFSEVEEDRMVSLVMARVSSKAVDNPVSLMELALRWLFPLLGSTAAAAWVFFSVLPGTPGLSAGPTAESYLYASPAENNSTQWSVLPAAYSADNDDMVVSLLK